MNTIIPINDNIIIKLPEQEKEIMTKSGIYLGNSNNQPKPDTGEVIAVGEGRLTMDGKIVPLKVEKGDTIIFNRYAGTEVCVGNDMYLIIKECDILAKIK